MTPFPSKTPLKFVVGTPIDPPEVALDGEVSSSGLLLLTCSFLVCDVLFEPYMHRMKLPQLCIHRSHHVCKVLGTPMMFFGPWGTNRAECFDCRRNARSR